MSIPQSFIQELLSRTDVVEIVGRYVQLKKGGANFMGLCPFHGEKSPSFSVSPAKQFYHCFGCGKNGNAISFLMDHAGMNFVEAVKDLAQQYGMQVPEEEGSPEDRARAQEQRQKQNTLTTVLERAGEAYRKFLKDSPKAVSYFKGRGVSGSIAKQFGLGYAPEGWRTLAGIFPNYDEPLLVESGLVISNQDDGATEEKRYDRFRDRVMFPIRNIKGECIGFGGRVLGDDKPKYLNSPETPVFSKGRELYGLYEARNALREHGFALVTEGYMDVVALAQLGFANTVATLGTACTADHVHKLFRFTDAVVFSFDGDGAGRRAARKALDAALPYATDVRSIKFLFLPQEHDPDSFIRAHGNAAFAEYIAQATPLSRFLVEAASEGCDLQTAEGRAHMASNAKPLWMQLPEGALKLQLLSELSALVQIDSAKLDALWQAAAPAPKQYAERAPQNRDGEHAEGGYSKSYGSQEKPWAKKWEKGTGKSSYRKGNNGGGDGPSYGGAASRRVRPTSRADHATRLLLAHTALWETLSSEDHGMLCALPAPHGPLIAWLEAQLHEHGPLTWSALQADLAGNTAADWATQLMAEANVDTPGADDTAAELRDLLNRMLVERIEALQTEAIAAASTDPTALQRYKDLGERRLQLVKQLEKSQTDAIMQG
ncbi:MAG: DNA primase [Burkholderiales bacterium PBB3]|nr:MAG: DNA primase [Burkholderiales bacterium PBB3]